MTMEFVYGEGLQRTKEHLFFESIVATTSLQTLYARLLVLNPIFPFNNFVIDTV